LAYGWTWTAWSDEHWHFGAVLGVDGGRKDRDPSGRMERGDSRVAGMGEIEASAEFGVFADYGPLSPQVQSALVWTKLLDQAADSPWVERDADASAVLGLVYRFR
jgi:hypothetical protein